MANMTVDVSVTDTELFKDIIALLKELSECDPAISSRLNEILSKYGMVNNNA